MNKRHTKTTCRKQPQPRRQSPHLGRGYASLGLVLLCFLSGCLDALPGKPKPEDRYQRPDTVMEFSALYGTHCAGCHGADGQLGAAPPLNDPLFLAICSDSDLKATVTNGREGTPMPAMTQKRGGPLTEKQIDALVSGIREKWGGKSAEFQQPLPKYRLSDSSENQKLTGKAEAGKQIFSQVCAACHGENGSGGKQAGALNDAAFLGTISDQALRRIIITGRSDLGMPDYRSVGENSTLGKPLSSQDIADLVAFLASWRTTDVGAND